MADFQSTAAPVGGLTSKWVSALSGTPLAWRVVSLALLFAAWEIAARTNFNLSSSCSSSRSVKVCSASRMICSTGRSFTLKGFMNSHLA